MFPCVGRYPEPDPEELRAFTDEHGPLRMLLSFQSEDQKKGCAGKHSGDFGCLHPPSCVRKGNWCQGGHPALGSRLTLSIPPDAMDRGLFGELSVQLVLLLTPCVLQYPNLETQLTHMQVFVYSPSNVPVTAPYSFFRNLPAHLDCGELGLHGLQCASSTDLFHSSRLLYKVEREKCEEPEQESSCPPLQQNLSMFLFLQHSDPFTSHPSDVVATEMLLEHHLEDILSNNRQVFSNALQYELKKTLNAQKHRNQEQEKLRSAAEVILSSAISIVSCSTNLHFRNACLTRMKVCDTHELSASFRLSLQRVTAWRFVPRGRCHATQFEEHPDTDEFARAEI
ncbi:type 2 DNA topoisomerase 6 subunit B-like [Aulostomus maculatus]